MVVCLHPFIHMYVDVDDVNVSSNAERYNVHVHAHAHAHAHGQWQFQSIDALHIQLTWIPAKVHRTCEPMSKINRDEAGSEPAKFTIHAYLMHVWFSHRGGNGSRE